jgi:hypothetical protein
MAISDEAKVRYFCGEQTCKLHLFIAEVCDALVRDCAGIF